MERRRRRRRRRRSGAEEEEEEEEEAKEAEAEKAAWTRGFDACMRMNLHTPEVVLG